MPGPSTSKNKRRQQGQRGFLANEQNNRPLMPLYDYSCNDSYFNMTPMADPQFCPAGDTLYNTNLNPYRSLRTRGFDSTPLRSPHQTRGYNHHQQFRRQEQYEEVPKLKVFKYSRDRGRQNTSTSLSVLSVASTSVSSASTSRTVKGKSNNKPKKQEEDNVVCCPRCLLKYDCSLRCGQYIGRVPLILNCSHTVCQICINELSLPNGVKCPICQVKSDCAMTDNAYEVFLPNFFIFGKILWGKSPNKDFHNISLAPAGSTKKKNIQPNQSVYEEGCCLLGCIRVATMQCPECADVYCKECCTRIHTSAKSLCNHTPLPISKDKDVITFEYCKTHKMEAEFLCKSCNVQTCCYCFIEKHDGHEKEQLSKLTEEESSNLLKYKTNAQKILKQLLASQKKINEMENWNAFTTKKIINDNFIDFHSKLQQIENKLYKEISEIQNLNESIEGLDSVSMEINNSIKEIKRVLSTYEKSRDKKTNLKILLETLEKIQDTPCYLLNKTEDPEDDIGGLEPIQLIVDPTLENLENCFNLRKCFNMKYCLVKEEQLPPDYQKEDFNSHSDSESCISSSAGTKRKSKKHIDRKDVKSANYSTPLKDQVIVTHIESLDSFYVQMKKSQYLLEQLNNDLNDFANLASPLEDPKISDLCLAVYDESPKKLWRRGRIIDIKKNNEGKIVYTIFFIDYGNTKTLDKSKIREIFPNLAQKKPFAIHCELYNPTDVNWSKNAHVYMAKFINKKDVYILIKDIQNRVHVVDLMIASTDRGLTSVIDILIHTCANALSRSNSDVSLDSTASFQIQHLSGQHKIYQNNTEFKKNEDECVILANVIDPHHIFIHIADHATSLNRMMTEMKHHYKRNGKKFATIPVEGNYVVVEHKDKVRGNWHRALVKKIDINSETATVLCVDWGLNLTVPWKKIYMLTEYFTKLELQAILIKLAHVEPRDKTLVWPKEATDFFKELYESRTILKMMVVNVDPLEVGLFRICDDNHICINALLVQKGFADSTGKLSQTLEWPKNLEEQEFSNEDSLIIMLLKQVNERGDDEESEDDDSGHVLKQKCEISKTISPGLMYVKFAALEEKETILHEEMQVAYSEKRETKESWEIDEYCVVRHSKGYVRGKIIEKKETNLYTVDMYDLGSEETFPIDQIFELLKYFRDMDNVLFPCHLVGIRPAGGDNWSQSSTEILESIFKKYPDIYATKIDDDSKKNSMPLKMWYTKVKFGGALEANTVKYVSINDLLVKMGLAYRVHSNQPQINVEEKKKLQKTSSSDSWARAVELEEEKIKNQQDSPFRKLKDPHWLAPLPLQQVEFEALITCAYSEGIIYLRQRAYNMLYETLEANLKEYFDKNPPMSDLSKQIWETGFICTISYKDYWYRGKVLDVKSDDKIEVFMIDFGSEHWVTSDLLRREILYLDIPPLASMVKLGGIYPKTGKWLDSDYQNLMNIIEENAKIVVTSSLSLDIPLVEIYSENGDSLNEALVDMCPNLVRTEVLNETLSDDDNVVIEEEMDLNPLKIFSANIDTTEFKYKRQLIKKKETQMFFGCVLAYNKFAIKPPFSPNAHLEQLNVEINQLADVQPVIENVKLEMPCICLYLEDNKWYRGQVYNIDGFAFGYVKVLFVDFGNTQSVDLENIKMMRPNWFEVPTSYQIAILNYELTSDTHMGIVSERINKLYSQTKLVKIVKKEPLIIDIYNDDNTTLYYQHEINKGFLKLTKS